MAGHLRRRSPVHLVIGKYPWWKPVLGLNGHLVRRLHLVMVLTPRGQCLWADSVAKKGHLGELC